MSIPEMPSSTADAPRFSSFRIAGLAVAATAGGVVMGVVSAYLAEYTPFGDFYIYAIAAYFLGGLLSQLAATFRVSNLAARRIVALIAWFAATYFAVAFFGVAAGTHPSPNLSLAQIGWYVGNALVGDGFGGRSAFLIAFSLGMFLFTLVLVVQAASQHRQRLFLPSGELPLLRRELTELANRRRTYIVRIVGAAVILLLVVDRYSVVMQSRMQMRGSFSVQGPTQFLGIGKEIFAAIVPQLFVIISLLLPALCCASVTSEKESNTIGTLLLTRLSPGTIVVEKFGSRLVPMLTLLLITFPVLAHVYALGGVDTDLLIGTIWLLLCQCFLVASMAIACSSWFGSTVGAFVCSYAIVGVMAAFTLSLRWQTFVPSAIWEGQFRGIYGGTNGMGIWPGGVPMTTPSWSAIVMASIPSLVFSGLFLTVARLVLVRRAFVSHSSILLKVFRALDGFFKSLNERTTGGVELVSDSDNPPEDDPIAWRERSKKSLGKARYLIRVLLALEFPVLFICMIAATGSARSAFEGLYILQGIVWTLCTLIVAVRAATLMTSERSRQTLEALLATPLTAREILDQKVVGIRRLLIVMSVPILTVNLTHFLIHVDTSSIASFFGSLRRPLIYLSLSTVSTFTFLYLITWISVGIGTRIHSQTKAVITAAVCLLLWVIVPMIGARLAAGAGTETVYELVLALSPFGTIRASEIYLIENFINDSLSSYRSIVTGDIPRIVLSMSSTFVQVLLLLLVRVFVRKCAPLLLDRRDTGTSVSPETVSYGKIQTLEGAST